MSETIETAALEAEAFVVFLGIGFGLLDMVLISSLALGAVYWLFFRNSSQSIDTTANFQSYTIQ